MAPLTDSHSKEDVKQAIEEIEMYVNEEDSSLKDRRKDRIVGWAISGLCHAMIILLFAAVIFAVKTDVDIEQPPLRITIIDKVEKKKEIEKSIDKNTSQIEIEIKDERNVTNPVVVESPDPSSAETLIDSDKPEPEGRLDALAAQELGSTGAFTAIGASGGGSGAFGTRSPSGRKKGLGQYGQNGKLAESTLDSGLRWLKRHQSPNGSWSATKYYANCDELPKCEPGMDQEGDTDAAMTGYALLCFLGAGYDHMTPNKYKKVVEKGLEYIGSIQKQNGIIGERNYEHAISTQALSEALAMTNDSRLKDAAQKGVNIILSRQNRGDNKNDPYSLLGWDYIDQNPSRNDISVSGWNVMALKSALAAGLNVGNGLNGGKNLIEKAWKAANPNWMKLDPYGKSIFPYTFDGITGVTEKDHLSFVGALCAVYTGHHAGDVMLETMLNDMDERWLARCSVYPHNLYASYYALAAAFQGGKAHFDKWKAIIPPLLAAQRKDGCFDGSWDSATDFHGANTGRVLSTVYALLDIEVVFRYDLVNKAK
jgi:hypothetical protein